MKKNVLFLWPPQVMFFGSLFKHITHVGETIDYCLKNTDANIEFLDAGVEMININTFVKKFLENNVLVIYCEVYTIEMSKKIAHMAKQINPNIKIIGFGKACCYMPQYFLQNYIFDAVVINGFWEKPIADFINEVPLGENAQYLTKDGLFGNIYQLKPEEWGIPAIEKLPIKRYFEITNKKQLEICVNKGCPYNCSFCSEKFVYGKHEGRRTVKSLIEYIEKTHNLCDSYYFDATTFTYDKNWVEEMCNAIIKLPYKIKWCSVTRLDELNQELIKKMAQAGCYRLSIGVETLNPNIQKSINKPIDIDLLFNTFNILKEYGIMPRALLIIGLPGQTKEEIITTYKKLLDLKIDFRIKELAPYNEILKDGVSDEIIHSFDRTVYYKNKINGIPDDLYMQMIFSDRGR